MDFFQKDRTYTWKTITFPFKWAMYLPDIVKKLDIARAEPHPWDVVITETGHGQWQVAFQHAYQCLADVRHEHHSAQLAGALQAFSRGGGRKERVFFAAAPAASWGRLKQQGGKEMHFSRERMYDEPL